jgi:hypothetical protein
MKYWGLLVAKVIAIAGFAGSTYWLIFRLMPVPPRTRIEAIGTDLAWTFAMALGFLAVCGLSWAAIADQRYRCRSCAARLRMPVATGSWGRATLFARPKMEYICPYGHGTMNIAQLQITGRETPQWDEHGDMWKELESIGSSRD